MAIVDLTLEQKEDLIDKLLTYMKTDIESVGYKIDQVWFDFSLHTPNWHDADGEDSVQFKKKVGINNDVLDKIIKICIANEYVSGRHQRLQLSRRGWARANSVEKARTYKPSETSSNYTFHGTVNLTNSQIGNNNQLEIHIQNDLENLVRFIENSNSTEQEKADAKNLLLAFIKHPLVTTAFGATLSTFIKSHFGG